MTSHTGVLTQIHNEINITFILLNTTATLQPIDQYML